MRFKVPGVSVAESSGFKGWVLKVWDENYWDAPEHLCWSKGFKMEPKSVQGFECRVIQM